MELLELATYVRIVEAGSLTAAARLTRQSLASVSRQLRALERDLGVELARRTTRHLSITPDGQALYEHAVRALRELESAREGARAGRLRGSLTISVPVTLGQSLVVPRLGVLLQQHPGLRLEVRLEDRLADLTAEGVDLVVRAGRAPPDSSSLIATPLFRFARVAVASPAYLRAHAGPQTVSALARHACLVQLGAAGPVRTWELSREDEQRSVEISGTLAATAPSVLHEAARSGVGIAFLPLWLVEDDLRARRLRRVLPEWSSPLITAWAIYRSQLRASASVRAFLDAMESKPEARTQPSRHPARANALRAD